MAKITMIGAGSTVFTKNLIYDILSTGILSESTICLMDINKTRLERVTKLANKVVEDYRFNVHIESTLDRKEALKGANYVITMIQVGGLEPYETDIAIPKKYGVDQSVGDTLGPGGIFRGLRTVPVLVDICRDMELLCPDALLLNYVNPMAINTWVLNEATSINMVGLCHSVQGTAELLAGFLGIPYDQFEYKVAGINHMAWFLKMEYDGEDLYPRLKNRVKDKKIYQQESIRIEIMKHFGYFVTESSYHISEYLPFYRKKEKWLNKISKIDSWMTESNGYYLDLCKLRMQQEIQEIEQEIKSNKQVEINRTHEYASYIIEAMESGKPTRINGNVMNNGLITNLPLESCVEVPCLVDKMGISPCYIGNLPQQLAALNRTNINVQELAKEAALTGNKQAVYHACMLDPLTSAILTPDEICQMVDDLFEAQNKYLPQFL